MNADRLLEHFERVSEAPDAVARLRRFVLDLAVRGKLVEQDPGDESAAVLLDRISAEKKRLVAEGKTRKQKALPAIGPEEAPFELPVGWGWQRLEQICVVFVDCPHKTPTYNPAGSYAAVRPRDVAGGSLRLESANRVLRKTLEAQNTRHFPQEGDVAYSRELSLGWGAVIPANVELCLSQGMMVMRPANTIDLQYFMTLLNGPMCRDQALRDAVGAAHPHLNLANIRCFLVPIPPLPEQHRIVAKVDELMALCDELEAAQTTRENRRDRLVAATLHRLNNGDTGPESEATFKQTAGFYFNHLPRLTTKPEHIQQLRQTILNLAVRGRLVPQDPGDEPAENLMRRAEAQKSQLIKDGRIKKAYSHQPIDTLGAPFRAPKNWCWTRLGSLCELVTSGSRDWAKHYSDDGAIFVRMGNLSRGSYELRMGNIQYVKAPAGGEGTRTRLKENDILISITGEVGSLGLIPPDFGEAYINQHTCLVRLFSTIWSRYVPELLRSPFAKDQFDAPQRGIKNSYRLSDVANLLIPLPPLAEQHRIVAKVDELMALCDQLETDLATAATSRHQLLESVCQQTLQPVENTTAARQIM
jgi:type I restriction enzyme, S subunit